MYIYIYVSLSLLGGPITFQGFVEISIFEIISCMHLPFIVHSCPFMFLSCSFHVPFIGIHFHSCSFHIPFIFIPMCIHVLSYSFHLHAFSFHFAFMSFHFLSKVMERPYGLAREPSATNGYR